MGQEYSRPAARFHLSLCGFFAFKPYRSLQVLAHLARQTAYLEFGLNLDLPDTMLGIAAHIIAVNAEFIAEFYRLDFCDVEGFAVRKLHFSEFRQCCAKMRTVGCTLTVEDYEAKLQEWNWFCQLLFERVGLRTHLGVINSTLRRCGVQRAEIIRCS